jgi:hypothetical protein
MSIEKCRSVITEICRSTVGLVEACYARGDLAGHDRAVDDLAGPWPALALPRVGEHRAQVGTDRRAAGRARLALGAAHDQARGDDVAVEDVFPFQSVDVRAAQAGVEGDRVGEAVLGLERGQQRCRLGWQ